MSYPNVRIRRLRRSENIRKLVRSISLSSADLLYPVFVKEGLEKKSEIKSLLGQYHYSLRTLEELVSECEAAGVPGLLIFGIPKKKDAIGSEAFSGRGIVQKAIERIKRHSKLAVFTDVCLCQYTSHGHCGILDKHGVNNDKTIELLGKVAVSHARAGADFVAPSGMMDGQVKTIRGALDDAGFEEVGIMSYSSKFASALYGPFRDAVESVPKKIEKLPYLSNRHTYQMDFHSREQAMREIALDIEEGADIIMVKPALPYLDVIREAKQKFNVPLAAYQVSGEYMMIKSASERGSVNEKDVFLETLIAIKRAGANFIITYAALDAARWLNET